MPALLTHYQFALRVFSKLKKAGVEVADVDCALIGAQGPDIFYFHRVLPWENGKSYAAVGNRLHDISPARLFEGFRSALNTEHRQYPFTLGYIEGMFCHYALDRATHPYIVWAQHQLQNQEPDYALRPNFYHYRIESALDTMTLRRETGRLISDFGLISVLPKDRDGRYQAIGRLYQTLLSRLFNIQASAENLALAPGDMRNALYLMSDRTMLRQKLFFRPVEILSHRGHFATPLLRPLDTGDWDYANEAHREWCNPYDENDTSTDTFFELYDFAANEAVDMITEFLSALSGGRSMLDITQDRGFGSDLPGIYEEKR